MRGAVPTLGGGGRGGCRVGISHQVVNGPALMLSCAYLRAQGGRPAAPRPPARRRPACAELSGQAVPEASGASLAGGALAAGLGDENKRPTLPSQPAGREGAPEAVLPPLPAAPAASACLASCTAHAPPASYAATCRVLPAPFRSTRTLAHHVVVRGSSGSQHMRTGGSQARPCAP